MLRGLSVQVPNHSWARSGLRGPIPGHDRSMRRRAGHVDPDVNGSAAISCWPAGRPLSASLPIAFTVENRSTKKG